MPVSAGEGFAAFAENGVITVFMAEDRVMYLRVLSGLNNARIGDPLEEVDCRLKLPMPPINQRVFMFVNLFLYMDGKSNGFGLLQF